MHPVIVVLNAENAVTDMQLLMLDLHEAVHVTAGDYAYDGWIMMIGKKKRSGAIRCVVEDEHGRLFIHNSGQISTREETT